MNPFKNRSFNVKIVDDKLTAAQEESGERRNPIDGVLVTQAYAQVIGDAVERIAEIAVASTVIVIAAKTGANVVNAGLKYLTK